MSLSDAPILKPENYEKWKNNMMLHLEAISDKMIEVIKNGPIVIQQLKQVMEVSNGRDRDPTDEEPSGGSSQTDALTSGRPTGQVVYEPKPRELWTMEDAKRNRLDGQARNIIIRSTPEHI